MTQIPGKHYVMKKGTLLQKENVSAFKLNYEGPGHTKSGDRVQGLSHLTCMRDTTSVLKNRANAN